VTPASITRIAAHPRERVERERVEEERP